LSSPSKADRLFFGLGVRRLYAQITSARATSQARERAAAMRRSVSILLAMQSAD
jgi:hypothetical protein